METGTEAFPIKRLAAKQLQTAVLGKEAPGVQDPADKSRARSYNEKKEYKQVLHRFYPGLNSSTKGETLCAQHS